MRPFATHEPDDRVDTPATDDGPPLRPGCRIGDDRELARLWEFLTGGVVPDSRTLWLAMLDAEGRATPTVFPIAHCPDEPQPVQLDNIAELVAHLVEEGLAVTVPVLLARPGPGAMTEQDRRWARLVRERFGAVTTRWATHLLTTSGLRPFAPDDLIVSAPTGGPIG